MVHDELSIYQILFLRYFLKHLLSNIEVELGQLYVHFEELVIISMAFRPYDNLEWVVYAIKRHLSPFLSLYRGIITLSNFSEAWVALTFFLEPCHNFSERTYNFKRLFECYYLLGILFWGAATIFFLLLLCHIKSFSIRDYCDILFVWELFASSPS